MEVQHEVQISVACRECQLFDAEGEALVGYIPRMVDGGDERRFQPSSLLPHARGGPQTEQQAVNV
jgi:hypothetical protein